MRKEEIKAKIFSKRKKLTPFNLYNVFPDNLYMTYPAKFKTGFN